MTNPIQNFKPICVSKIVHHEKVGDKLKIVHEDGSEHLISYWVLEAIGGDLKSIHSIQAP